MSNTELIKEVKKYISYRRNLLYRMQEYHDEPTAIKIDGEIAGLNWVDELLDLIEEGHFDEQDN